MKGWPLELRHTLTILVILLVVAGGITWHFIQEGQKEGAPFRAPAIELDIEPRKDGYLFTVTKAEQATTLDAWSGYVKPNHGLGPNTFFRLDWIFKEQYLDGWSPHNTTIWPVLNPQTMPWGRFDTGSQFVIPLNTSWTHGLYRFGLKHEPTGESTIETGLPDNSQAQDPLPEYPWGNHYTTVEALENLTIHTSNNSQRSYMLLNHQVFELEIYYNGTQNLDNVTYSWATELVELSSHLNRNFTIFANQTTKLSALMQLSEDDVSVLALFKGYSAFPLVLTLWDGSGNELATVTYHGNWLYMKGTHSVYPVPSFQLSLGWLSTSLLVWALTVHMRLERN